MGNYLREKNMALFSWKQNELLHITQQEYWSHHVFLFFDTFPKVIRVEEWISACLLFIGLPKYFSSASVDIFCEWKDIQLSIYWIFASKESEKLTVSVNTYIKDSACKVDKHFMSFLWEGGDVAIDADIYIAPWTKKVVWSLLEENIILWKHTRIKALPMLDIHSADVQASHGVKIEKIDKEKLFYMQTKGLTISQAQEMILDSYLNVVFAEVDTSEQALQETFKQYLLSS